MAHLKGGTFVDGKLYVQDAIVVNKIQAPDGTAFPYINITDAHDFNETGTNKTAVGYIAGYSTTDGGLDNAPIAYKYDGDSIIVSFMKSRDSNREDILKTSDILIGNTSADIKLDADGRTWKLV